MRLVAFGMEEYGPIAKVAVDNLSDVIVLAGPNGVGKTTIIGGLLSLALTPVSNSKLWMKVEATSKEEEKRWRKKLLDTRYPADVAILTASLKKNQRRNQYTSSFLNFDSDRAVRNIKSLAFSWDFPDPLQEEVDWKLGLNAMTGRHADVRHSLFKLVENQKRSIADEALALKRSGSSEMPLDFEDVLKPFKDAFYQLLAPKRLVEVNAKDQKIFFQSAGKKLSIDALSSGEREVVNIVFDVLLRNPKDCIIIFDEPELHLHPELSFKLLQTLSGIGNNNQFLFSTHSPEIITASLENTVVFVSPKNASGENQAIVINQDDETHAALQSLGQSIGVISLGKKLILIEGQQASLDKQTYGAILRGRFPDFILVPVGGKGALRSFDEIKSSIIDRTIWGVEFFMLCDRDAINELGPDAMAAHASKRIRNLPRYHLENYFLRGDVIAKAFEGVESEGAWERDADAVTNKIDTIARSVVPYAVALNVNAVIRERVGNVSLMPKGAGEAKSSDELTALMLERVGNERARVAENLDDQVIIDLIDVEYRSLMESINLGGPERLYNIPGRTILNKFSASVGMKVGRLKQMYLNTGVPMGAFDEIVAIFGEFAAASNK